MWKGGEESGDDTMARIWAQAAHDLRQPVQTARLLASLLDERSGRGELERATRGIGSALQLLHEMLEALTLIARTEAGLLMVELSACGLAGVLGPALRERAEAAASRGIRLRLRRLQGEVRSHPELLAMVARSLILNAIRFGDGGEILVGSRRRRDRITLEVWFAGAALGRNVEAHAFVELASTGDPLSAGELGLGLALLRRLCRPLGHDLQYTVSGSDRHRLVLTMPLPGAAVGTG